MKYTFHCPVPSGEPCVTRHERRRLPSSTTRLHRGCRDPHVRQRTPSNFATSQSAVVPGCVAFATSNPSRPPVESWTVKRSRAWLSKPAGFIFICPTKSRPAPRLLFLLWQNFAWQRPCNRLSDVAWISNPSRRLVRDLIDSSQP